MDHPWHYIGSVDAFLFAVIVGDGDIARILNDRKGALFFASGVSNSACIFESEFSREKQLLLAQDFKLCCFYFSSIACELIDTPYYRHKLRMENMVKSNFNNYHILRLGNISWGNNPHTFRNYIRNARDRGQPVEIKDEYRYMIDKDDLLFLTDNLPLYGQNVISVFSRMAKVKDLI